MARKKRVTKPKEPIKLRFRTLANGNQSIMLDCYVNGRRTYEFLKLYLVPEDGSQMRAIQNANTMQAALAIKAQRIQEIINGKAGITPISSKGKVSFYDFLEMVRLQKLETGQSKSNSDSFKSLTEHMRRYRGNKIIMKDIDSNFCRGFIKYLANAECINYKTTKKPLAQGAANAYFRAFSNAIKQAVKQNYLASNPIKLLEREDLAPVSRAESTRTYLSIEELKQLIKTDCRNEQIKKAFLFSCFSGLRISDIRTLQWKHFHTIDGEIRIRKNIIKTRRDLEIPLSQTALKYLPEHNGKSDSDYVFELPVTNYCVNSVLKTWAKQAGITQNLCFHMSRHTFATLELTLDADLYTVSKLMGHQNIAITQVYADIINKKKSTAVSKQDTLFTSDNE